MIESPPKLTQKLLQAAVSRMNDPEMKSVLEPINARYLYWSEVKYRERPDGLSPEVL